MALVNGMPTQLYGSLYSPDIVVALLRMISSGFPICAVHRGAMVCATWVVSSYMHRNYMLSVWVSHIGPKVY
jgi:hypothetical protein